LPVGSRGEIRRPVESTGDGERLRKETIAYG
jgi:hypothetical protein